MYTFLAKRQAKDNYYFDVYFMGCLVSVRVPKSYYDECDLNTGDLIPDDLIQQTFYKKGYDLVCSLKLKGGN